MKSLLSSGSWFLIFLFPLGIMLLSRGAGERTAPWWPLLAFYGAALLAAAFGFWLVRTWFRHVALPLSVRRRIIKAIFLIPLIPGLVYLGFVFLRLTHGG